MHSGCRARFGGAETLACGAPWIVCSYSVLPHTRRRAYVRELGNIELAQVEGVEGIYLARVDDVVADGDDCTDDEGADADGEDGSGSEGEGMDSE